MLVVLGAQTEKQRIIWAYKILFLDVLFPLSLRKVIFADADQIMRTDLAHLWHMDLQVCLPDLSPRLDLPVLLSALAVQRLHSVEPHI